jgi:hypothetical protein
MTDIRIDGGTQARVTVDPHWVKEMIDNMKNDVEYDAVEARFDGATYWLTDGFHRYHAYTQLGLKEIQVSFLPGTQFDAQLDAYGANDKHGKPLTREDKENKVRLALNNPLIEDKTNYYIAKLCKVSQSFVASVRDPAVKEKQADAKKQHILKKAEKIRENTDKKGDVNTSLTSNQKVPDAEKPQIPVGGEAPDDAEIKANQQKHEADLERLAEFLDADDKMAHLYEENEQLKHQVVILELRITELMNEKNAAIKMVKSLQKQIDKAKK